MVMKRIQCWLNKRKYRPGRTISRFIACDIRRDVEVVDASEIETGIITAKIRTWNVLYQIKGIKGIPPFGETERMRIDELWDWGGQPWGGPVPDGSATGAVPAAGSPAMKPGCDRRLLDASTRWVLWYYDKFDRGPASQESSGEGIVAGLMELWDHVLGEGVDDDGKASFSSFHLTWGEGTVGERVDVAVEPFDNRALAKLRRWVYPSSGAAPAMTAEGRNTALLEAVAKAHFQRLLDSDRWTSESICCNDESKPLLNRVLRAAYPGELSLDGKQKVASLNPVFSSSGRPKRASRKNPESWGRSGIRPRAPRTGSGSRSLKDESAAWDALAERLQDPDGNVRESSAFQLVHCEDRALLCRAIDRLIAAAEDPSTEVRENIAVALQESQDPRALQALIRLAGDKAPSVQIVAAHQLGVFGDRTAIAPLVAAFENTPDLHVREEILRTLDLLGHPTGDLRERLEVFDPIKMVLTWLETGRACYSDSRNEKALAANFRREGAPAVDRLAEILGDRLHARSERILDVFIALSPGMPLTPRLEAVLKEIASDGWCRALDPRALPFIDWILKGSGPRRTPPTDE